MKKIRLTYIIAAFPLLFSCNGNEESGPLNPVDLEWGGYIVFDTEVATRGALYTASTLSGQNFGVLGYKYTNSTPWDTYKATATPNVFSNTPQQVTWSSTSYTYNPLQQWENGSRYTFFGYYPWGLNIVSTSGVQYINYSQPTDPAQMSDVMTGMISDIDNSGNGVVGLTFWHRLCCLNVEARNLNEDTEQIYDLKITINSPMYSSAQIPLDHNMAITPGTVDSSSKTYQIIPNDASQKVSIPKYTGEATDLSGDNNILFIPQQQSVMGNLSGTISFKDKNGNARPNSTQLDIDNCKFDSSKNFEAGKKYTLVLNFSDEAISIAIIESGEWTDKGQSIIFE